jgi:hypothetical protein
MATYEDNDRGAEGGIFFYKTYSVPYLPPLPPPLNTSYSPLHTHTLKHVQRPPLFNNLHDNTYNPMSPTCTPSRKEYEDTDRRKGNMSSS